MKDVRVPKSSADPPRTTRHRPYPDHRSPVHRSHQRVIDAAQPLKRSMMRHLFTYGPVPVGEAGQVRLKETEVGRVPEGWEVMTLGTAVGMSGGSIQTGPFGSQLHAVGLCRAWDTICDAKRFGAIRGNTPFVDSENWST